MNWTAILKWNTKIHIISLSNKRFKKKIQIVIILQLQTHKPNNMGFDGIILIDSVVLVLENGFQPIINEISVFAEESALSEISCETAQDP